MVYYKNGQWHICEEKVKYIQHGEEITQYVGQEGHDWWADFEQKWEHTEILEFIPIESAYDEIERLGEVNKLNIPDGFSEEVGNYVKDGVFPEGANHKLRQLQIQKEQLQQDEYLVDLGFRQSLSEMGVEL